MKWYLLVPLNNEIWITVVIVIVIVIVVGVVEL